MANIKRVDKSILNKKSIEEYMSTFLAHKLIRSSKFIEFFLFAEDSEFRTKMTQDNSIINKIANLFGNDITFRKRTLEKLSDKSSELRLLQKNDKDKLRFFLMELRMLNSTNNDFLKDISNLTCQIYRL